ncbi:MAG: IS1595 family transposase [Nitrososphaerales archaeon]
MGDHPFSIPFGVIRLLLALILDEHMCAMLLRIARWFNGAYCPRCNSTGVNRYGKYKKIFQRYYCNECHHTFNDNTGTIFHYSHLSLSEWFLAIYLFCIPWMGCSIMSISNQLEIPYRQCYHMIRAIMERLASVEHKMLDGAVEIDELYTRAGMKERNYHGLIIKHRMPRRRGIRPRRGRGSFDKDTPMVMCYHQRNGSTVFDVPVSYDSIASLVCKKVGYGSTVYTDEYVAYSPLKASGFEHESVSHSSKEYARGEVHVNNCECRTNLFKLWISKFMGVNKYNPHLYAKTFQFLHNDRHLDGYEKFMRILSVLIIATTLYIMSE